MSDNFPRPGRALTAITQVFLCALFLVGIGVVALLPGLSSSVAAVLPEYAQLRAPLLALAIAFTVLALATVAVTALLVRRIRRATVLARTSLFWVDAIIASLACAALVLILGFVVISNGQAGSPSLALLMTTTLLVLAVLGCVTLVLRSLLQHAILIRTELDEVV